ncbi:GNAT family N-acetyltransferase [Mucilaginibacter sp. Bleaf8]|uniref:GNAT family N-acetyltransferase n=1 Tax=Mucilaginibacter sp. Bleaf8 TaxID=2834430 RepID=UPI001BCDD137|nr:GNAT family N-acetyltransferase [Mucilaginibacter sp. Bleaf8]MBS7563729.1 GNAT family N-acetyltransferase [Mucilaginibacter sp. Bleaf8]
MVHPLDNPIWSALNTGNKHLALGNDLAKHFESDVALFVAVKNNEREAYQALWNMIEHDQTVVAFSKEKHIDAAPWSLINRIDGLQMLFEGATPLPNNETEITALIETNVPAMLALTQLVPPGPFYKQTIRFGGYEGIFSGEELVAMAGQRFHSGPYVEISAVCTHTNHMGKGYARQLINSQIRRIQAQGNTPYLHVRADNTRAIQIYQDLGFVTRSEMNFYILKK